MKRIISAVLFAVAMVILSGCSGESVTSPSNSYSKEPLTISSLPLWVSDVDSSGNPLSGQGILGTFSVHIETQTLSGELTSLRKSSLEDVLEVVDITNFLMIAPCTDCVKLKSIELDPDGHVDVGIGIRHPFAAGDIFKPISGRNRADLHVFNVEGIVISDGAAVTSFPSLNVSTGGFRLLNADGYTGYLDASLDEIFPTASNIHPYITHFADYSEGNFNAANPMGFESVTDPPPSGNLVMPMGSAEDVRHYVFDLASGNIDYIFAVGCTYAVSAANKSQRFNPEYRVPQHNKKAASKVGVIIDSNDLRAGDTSSQAQMTIEVLDINHGVAVGTALNEMRADSSVASIQVDIPGVMTAPVSFSTAPISGNGRDPADPLKFTGTVTNNSGASEGTYEGIVKVTDSYSTGLNESPLLNGLDGIKRVGPIENPLSGLFTITEFATYQTFSIIVELGNENPVAILKPNPARACVGSTVWFNGNESYDIDGTIVTYEFDFDLDGGDPANFAADISGTESRAQSLIYPNVGSFVAALRVIDNLGASDIDTVDVTVSAIDGLDIAPYQKAYVTDTTFSGIIFTPNGFDPAQTQNRQYGLEAMATGTDYIFAIFFGTGSQGTGVYIARSNDSGETWGDYNLVRLFPGGSGYGGAAIDVVGNEVYIAIGQTNPLSLYFEYNNNNGEGSFTERQISNTIGEASVSIVVDDQDTNNIYVGAANLNYGIYITTAWIFSSNTGPTGTFTAVQRDTWFRPPPYGYNTQGYTMELKVASDQDVYMFETANATLAVYKSTDFGATFTEIYGTWDPQGSWGRDSDTCFDPGNPETIHWVTTYRVMGTGWRHVYRRSTNGGVAWSVINSHMETGNNTGYTNISICADSAAGLYVAYTDNSTGNGEVYGRYSNTGGTTFTSPMQVSTDPLNDGHVEIITTTDGCDVIFGWLEDRDGARRVVSRRG